MRVQTALMEMERFEFDLKPYFHDGPIARATLKRSMDVSVHEADDEQIAAAFDTGMVDSIRVIVDRADGQPPFLCFDVCIPGVNVTYYWRPEGHCADDKVAVLVKFGEAMTEQGCGGAGALSTLKRLAGIADPAGGDG